MALVGKWRQVASYLLLGGTLLPPMALEQRLQHQTSSFDSSRRNPQPASPKNRTLKMPPKRMTANPVRPGRHFAGKAAGGSSSSDSDDSGTEQEIKPEPPKKRTIAPPPKVPSAGRIISTSSSANKASDEAKKLAAAKQRAELERKAKEEGFVTEDEDGESEEGEEESSGEDESSSEAESSSEEEAPRRLMVRPKFISKANRAKQEEDPAKKAEEEEAKRRAEADAIVEEQIQKDLAAARAGKKHWDDDEGSEDEVDDTDDLDPAAEYAAWKLRELKRLKRAREAIEAKEAEIAEKERRQNLTEAERAAEDEALVAKQREEKESRGKMGYMQKYFHKGAFYQDEAAAQGLDKRDIMGARFADDVRNRELLPQALQMRDMTKLGKKGATKYKDLKSEDTGAWGRYDDPRRKRSEWDQYRDGEREGDRGGDYGGNGANAMPLGRRRSRSRSPRRDRDDHRDRKREYSRERDRYDDDKRRRVDSR